MRKIYCCCFVSALLLAGSVALAGTVPTISPLEFGDTSIAAVSAINASPEAHWIWTLLASEIVAGVAGWLFLRVYNLIKNTRYAKAVEAVRDAVTACYHEYVRAIKAASGTGKMTIEQKNEALNRAYRTAIEFARTRGVDLLKIMAKETVVALIEKFVVQSKAVPAPLPDLALPGTSGA